MNIRKDMQLVNYAGNRLSLSMDQQISILPRAAIDSQMGPFYELESVSPAAFLAPGGKVDTN